MFYYQIRNDLQKKYYDTWVEVGVDGGEKVLELLLSETPTGNHYRDRYIYLKNIHKKLHPYQFVNKNDVVIACGCHNGKIDIGTSQPLIFSTLAKKVIVLEPDPVNIKALENYIEKYSIKNIEIVPKAVWHTETTVEFTVCEKTESNQIGKIKNKGTQIQVHTVTLDQLNKEYGPVNFVHLTINNFELEALQGAEKLLETDVRVSIAMIAEKHGMFSKRMKALQLLKENGYYIGCADGPPRAWKKRNFYFAVGIKNKNRLKQLRFKEQEIPW